MTVMTLTGLFNQPITAPAFLNIGRIHIPLHKIQDLLNCRCLGPNHFFSTSPSTPLLTLRYTLPSLTSTEAMQRIQSTACLCSFILFAYFTVPHYSSWLFMFQDMSLSSSPSHYPISPHIHIVSHFPEHSYDPVLSAALTFLFTTSIQVRSPVYTSHIFVLVFWNLSGSALYHSLLWLRSLQYNVDSMPMFWEHSIFLKRVCQ